MQLSLIIKESRYRYFRQEQMKQRPWGKHCLFSMASSPCFHITRGHLPGVVTARKGLCSSTSVTCKTMSHGFAHRSDGGICLVEAFSSQTLVYQVDRHCAAHSSFSHSVFFQMPLVYAGRKTVSGASSSLILHSVSKSSDDSL